MLLFLTVILIAALVSSTAWRWGLFAKSPIASALERVARDRGYVLNDDRTSLSAVVDGVTINVAVLVVPSHGGPLTVCSLRAKARQPALGRVSMQPKHEDAPALMRVGHVDLDTCFRIDTSSRDLAYELFDEEARRALLAFGPRGDLLYLDGDVTFQWDLLDFVTSEDVDAALAIVRALCRMRRPVVPYRE